MKAFYFLLLTVSLQSFSAPHPRLEPYSFLVLPKAAAIFDFMHPEAQDTECIEIRTNLPYSWDAKPFLKSLVLTDYRAGRSQDLESTRESSFEEHQEMPVHYRLSSLGKDNGGIVRIKTRSGTTFGKVLENFVAGRRIIDTPSPQMIILLVPCP